MTLHDIEARALTQYPGMAAAEAQIEASEAKLNEIRVSPFFQSFVTLYGTFAPDMTGSAILSPDSQLPLSNNWSPLFGASIEGAIPLWTFGKLDAARDASQAGIDASEQNLARAKAQLLFQVRKAFFGYQYALDLLQLVSEAKPKLEEYKSKLEEEMRASADPVTLTTDLYKLQMAIAELRQGERTAVQLERMSKEALMLVLGLNEGEREYFETLDCELLPYEPLLPPREQLVRHVEEERPELLMIKAAMKAREASLSATRASYFPDLVLTYKISYAFAPGIADQNNPFVYDPLNFTGLGAALVLRQPLDIWGNAYREDREEGLLLELRHQSEEALLGITLEVDAAYEAATASKDKIEIWQGAMESSRTWFVTELQNADLGIAKSQDIVDAGRAYMQARVAFLTARFESNVAVADLERASQYPLWSSVVGQGQPKCAE